MKNKITLSVKLNALKLL